jgi:hypothetical protein
VFFFSNISQTGIKQQAKSPSSNSFFLPNRNQAVGKIFLSSLHSQLYDVFLKAGRT